MAFAFWIFASEMATYYSGQGVVVISPSITMDTLSENPAWILNVERALVFYKTWINSSYFTRPNSIRCVVELCTNGCGKLSSATFGGGGKINYLKVFQSASHVGI
jgi:hypothetical protein